MTKFRSLILPLMLTCSVSQAETYINPSDIGWLPVELKERLKESKCKTPLSIEWAGDIKIPSRGVLVGQFAAQGQYDIAIICQTPESDRIFIHWGGSIKCSNEFINRGESIEIENEETMQKYLKRYGSNNWPSKLSHDPIGMYIFGKSSFYKYCHNGKWLHSDGAD